MIAAAEALQTLSSGWFLETRLAHSNRSCHWIRHHHFVWEKAANEGQ